MLYISFWITFFAKNFLYKWDLKFKASSDLICTLIWPQTASKCDTPSSQKLIFKINFFLHVRIFWISLNALFGPGTTVTESLRVGQHFTMLPVTICWHFQGFQGLWKQLNENCYVEHQKCVMMNTSTLPGPA